MRTLIALALLTAYSPTALALPVCPAPPATRSDCIHDVDTWWFEGVKYRHSEIDTPEIGHTAGCTAEFEVGLKARDRLVELMAGGFTIEPTGENDRYGRVLATIQLADGREAGEVLVAEGLAEPYGADPATDWCAAS
jgi:endonuclease YncB( thermonuclease family)